MTEPRIGLFAAIHPDRSADEMVKTVRNVPLWVCRRVDEERPGATVALNDVIMQKIGSVDLVGLVADDIRIRTPDWKPAVVKAWQAGARVIYPNDGYATPALATHPIVDARMVRALGWFAPPCLWHLYVDNFWMEIGHEVGLWYMADVMFEHLHPFAGKARMDACYKRTSVGATAEHDYHAWARFRTLEFRQCVEICRKAVTEPCPA